MAQIRTEEKASFVVGLVFFCMGYGLMMLVVAPIVALVKGATRAVQHTRSTWKDI